MSDVKVEVGSAAGGSASAASRVLTHLGATADIVHASSPLWFSFGVAFLRTRGYTSDLVL
jgi:hypothetical protein